MMWPGRILLLLIMLMLVAVAPARSNDYIVRFGTRESSETRRMETSPYNHAKRAYIYGGYNFHFPGNMLDMDVTRYHGNLFGGIGARWTNTVRTELAFEQFVTDWEDLGEAHGYFGFVNVLFDAKVDGAFQRHVTSPFTPFIGFGAGAGIFEFGNSTVTQSRRINGAYNLIAGVSIDLNRTVALVLSYRYTRILTANNFDWENFHGYDQMLDADGDPMFDLDGDPIWDYNSPIISVHDFQGFKPTSHNVGFSIRMSF